MNKKSIIAVFAVALLVANNISAQKLSAEDIIAKHLAAIGTAEKRAEVKTLIAAGASEFEASSPVVKGGGKAIVVSDPNNLFFLISLNSKEYPFEKVGYFNGKVDLPFINSGKRSLLGTFLAEHSKVLSDGLFGGVLSHRWSLAEKELPKLSAAGSKKIDDRKAYAIEYLSSDLGTDFTVRLYFDAETFHHVRSEYRREVVPNSPRVGRQNQITNSELTLTESFSEFKSVDGLTLPHRYSVTFASNSNTSVMENTWRILVQKYIVNQALAPDFFTFDIK
ncbi:MAG TPA: hypothetical protein PKA82_06685 [Pyrinomonadaceae bacterium]|nr:hypothetical protein [Pyrinomonadaceae bacterium]